MDKVLQPTRLVLNPDSPTASREYQHWLHTFEVFAATLSLPASYASRKSDDVTEEILLDKLKLDTLTNLISSDIWMDIRHCQTYKEAKVAMDDMFIKLPSKVYAVYKLLHTKQEDDQSLEAYRRTLDRLSRDCNFTDVSAAKYREDMVLHAFLAGLKSNDIRKRLLEEKELSFHDAFKLAVARSESHKEADHFEKSGINHNMSRISLASTSIEKTLSPPRFEQEALASASPNAQCLYCGREPHVRANCPARNSECYACGVAGHWGSVCQNPKKRRSRQPRRQNRYNRSAAASSHHQEPVRASNADIERVYTDHVSRISCSSDSNTVPTCLDYATIPSYINNIKCDTLVDSGSSSSFIDADFANNLNLTILPSRDVITLANRGSHNQLLGVCYVDLTINESVYKKVKLGVFKSLCAQVLLGGDFLRKHSQVIFKFKTNGQDLVIDSSNTCAVAKSNVECPSLFANLLPDCHPIATKSRRYNSDQKQFIDQTIQEWLSEGTIRPSQSPWRAQVVIVTVNGKRRLCIDFSQTINLYTLLDAYPIPRIDDMVNSLAKYKYFSTFDLRSAYHQIPIRESDKIFTAFEAGGKLYEWNCIPFGVTNGGPVFQRIMDDIVKEEGLEHTYPYFDNITVGGFSKSDLEVNEKAFLRALESRHMTLNDSKTVSSVPELSILGYCVGNGKVRPDPDRLRVLKELPVPYTQKSLQRAMGLFAYYAKWIPNYSDKVKLLNSVDSFPLSEDAVKDYEELKSAIAEATLQAIDDSIPFTVECDASEIAVSATLNQTGRPVAFFSRTLSKSELHYPAVEKEAMCIIEAVRKWSHLLIRQSFTLITDQKSVAFMLDNRKRTKIKNNKILSWRLELAPFSFDIQYRPGEANVGPDTLTRAFCSALSTPSLMDIHKGLGCPGVARLHHFVKVKNLPFSISDIRSVCSSCDTCAELRPKFYSPPECHLIKATQPMERLNIDFKGPLPSSSRNKYFLCVVDEYSRFPFCFPCADMSTSTITRCFDSLFYTYGTCSYVHSDRWSSFKSDELKTYFLSKGIASSMSTPYNPRGNGQVERYNGIIWQATKSLLKNKNLETKYWEVVLPQALHSIRSLLCTSTNQTPHDRFFNFARRSTTSNVLPGWLTSPGPVMLRNFVRSSKHDDLVQRVHLVEANPHYALVEYPNGRQSNVSLRDLAPCPPSDDSAPRVADSPVERTVDEPSVDNVFNSQSPTDPSISSPSTKTTSCDSPVPDNAPAIATNPSISEPVLNNTASPEAPLVRTLRRSSRSTRGSIPERLHEYVTHG